jgi:hypothetical protein
MREDGCVMPWHPTHGVKASSSRAALAAPDGPATRPEQELWQEFRDLGALLNNALIEALRIHAGPADLLGFGVFPSPLSLVSPALEVPLTQLPSRLVRW